jgi:hypothetical protein
VYAVARASTEAIDRMRNTVALSAGTRITKASRGMKIRVSIMRVCAAITGSVRAVAGTLRCKRPG